MMPEGSAPPGEYGSAGYAYPNYNQQTSNGSYYSAQYPDSAAGGADTQSYGSQYSAGGGGAAPGYGNNGYGGGYNQKSAVGWGGSYNTTGSTTKGGGKSSSSSKGGAAPGGQGSSPAGRYGGYTAYGQQHGSAPAGQHHDPYGGGHPPPAGAGGDQHLQPAGGSNSYNGAAAPGYPPAYPASSHPGYNGTPAAGAPPPSYGAPPPQGGAAAAGGYWGAGAGAPAAALGYGSSAASGAAYPYGASGAAPGYQTPSHQSGTPNGGPGTGYPPAGGGASAPPPYGAPPHPPPSLLPQHLKGGAGFPPAAPPSLPRPLPPTYADPYLKEPYGSNAAPDPYDDKTVGQSAMVTPGFYDASNNWIPKYIGYLKSYNANQGYGFISCTETYSIHKQDVFIHKAQVEEKNTGQPEIGQWVEFVVKTNERGQPQARNVVWLEGKIDPGKMENAATSPASPNSGQNSGKGHSPVSDSQQSAAKGSNKAGEKRSKDAKAPLVSDSSKGTSDLLPEGKIYQGSLKSFSQNSGYGFIHCQELWDKFKRDVYVHKAEMPKDGDCRAAMTCDFEASLNPKGQPQAKNVKWQNK